MIGALKQRPQRFLLAGLLLGLSLQTKMFTAIMLPSVICAVLFVPNSPARKDPRRARDVALTLAATLGTFLAIAIAMHEPLLAQLISPHLWNSAIAANASEYHGWIYFGSLLAEEPVVLGLGVAGFVATLLRPRDLDGARLIPILWLCVSVITFAYHRPVWPHHLPMTLVPLAWLGGVAVGLAMAWLRTRGMRTAYLNALGVAVLAPLIVDEILETPDFRSVPPLQNPIASAMVEFRIDPTAEPWVLTDNAMDAYRAGVLVPAELAVYTGNRVSHGYLPVELIISVIRDRRPSQVMFRRFPIEPQVQRYLNDSGYVRMIWSAEPHYIRGDLARAKSGL